MFAFINPIRLILIRNSNTNTDTPIGCVRLQITSGRYRTKHGQAIRTEFIEEFAHIEHVQSGKTNSSMNSVRIA